MFTQLLDTIRQNSTKIDVTYECILDPTKLERFETGYWNIILTGKDTYKYRKEIKNSGFKWEPEKKIWKNMVHAHHVPKEEKTSKSKIYIKILPHIEWLRYTRWRTKCSTPYCNEENPINENICSTCKYKESCRGGLHCPGWMSNKCKYSGITQKGHRSCKQCKTDAAEWATGNWFKDDNS